MTKLLSTIVKITVWPLLFGVLFYVYWLNTAATVDDLSSTEFSVVADTTPTSVPTLTPEPTATLTPTIAPTATLPPEETATAAVVPEDTNDTGDEGAEVVAVVEVDPTVSPFEGRVWQSLDTTGGGGLTSVATHPTNPNIAYIASDNSGLYKTETRGDRWFSVASNLGAYRLGFVILDPLDPTVIYVTAKTDNGQGIKGGASGEIHRTRNDGQSWAFVSGEMGLQSSFPSQTSIAIPYDATDPNRFDQDDDNLSDVLVVAAWTGPADPPVGGIWRSEDEGQTFEQVALANKNMTTIRSFADDPNILFAANYEGEVYRSDDTGLTWVDISGNLPISDVSDMAIHPVDANILYVTCRWCETDDPPVWKTIDGGQTWSVASDGLDHQNITGFPRILMDRNDAETLYVSTFITRPEFGAIYKSIDGGKRWLPMPFRLILPDGRPFHLNKFSRQLMLGQGIDGTLYSSGSGAWRYPDGDLSDNVDEWEPATIGIGNVHVNRIAIDPQNPAILYQGISDFGPYKSTDGGLNFSRILGTGWPVTTENFIWNGPYYGNYFHCTLACSTSCRGGGKLGSGGTTDFAISQQDSNIVYSAFGSGSGGLRHGGVNKSIDGGATWQPVGFQLENGFVLSPDLCVPYGVPHIEIDPTNDQVVFAAQSVEGELIGKVFRTEDGGLNWVEVFANDRFITDVQISSENPSLVVVATRQKVFKSENGGQLDSWQEISPPEAGQLRTVRLSPHNEAVMVVGTNSNGFFYTADGGVSWTQNRLDGLFTQKVQQDSQENLDSAIATSFNPNKKMLRNISTITFDPVLPDTFYVAGRQFSRTTFGVAQITNGGQTWDRLPLAGLSSRNVFDLELDPSGKYLYAGTFNGTYRIELR